MDTSASQVWTPLVLKYGRLWFSSMDTFDSQVWTLLVLKSGRLWFSSMDASPRKNYERATAPRIPTHCTPKARNGFLRLDPASPVSLVPSMHFRFNEVMSFIGQYFKKIASFLILSLYSHYDVDTSEPMASILENQRRPYLRTRGVHT